MTSYVATTLPPLLPTPARCLLLTPPPAVYTPRVELDTKKHQPGRASQSQSWIKDKVNMQKMIPGRATLSSNWVADKIPRPAETSSGSVERLGRRQTSRENWKRPASRAPSVDRCEKKPRSPTEMVADSVVTSSEASISVGPAPSAGRSEKEAKPTTEMVADSEATSFAGPAASVDRSEKKPMPPTVVEASPFAGLAPLIDWSEKKPEEPLTKMEVDSEPEASFFAGPTFIVSPDPSELPMPTFILSPDPSELPIPTFLYKHKVARVFARLVAPMLIDQQD